MPNASVPGHLFPRPSYCFSLLFFFQFGTRFIIEAMQTAGHSLSTLFLCGGLSKNPLFVQMHADITGKPHGGGSGDDTLFGWSTSGCGSLKAG